MAQDVTRSAPRPALAGQRLTMQRALAFLEVEWPDIYRRKNTYGTWPAAPGMLQHTHQPFWERNAEHLDLLAYEIHQAYRRKAKQLRPDLTENHAQACELNAVYTFARRMLHQRGIPC